MRGDTVRSLSESGLRSIIDTSHRARIKKHHVHRFVYIALITVFRTQLRSFGSQCIEQCPWTDSRRLAHHRENEGLPCLVKRTSGSRGFAYGPTFGLTYDLYKLLIDEVERFFERPERN